jgi:hypothetical protein
MNRLAMVVGVDFFVFFDADAVIVGEDFVCEVVEWKAE